jgi:hypothetical protein
MALQSFLNFFLNFLRLTRSGNLITAYVSDDQITWLEVGSYTLTNLPEVLKKIFFNTKC